MVRSPDRIGAEEPAEEQHLGSKKEPHTEFASFKLLHRILPVVAKELRVIMIVIMPVLLMAV
jgi:hypothetical protein